VAPSGPHRGCSVARRCDADRARALLRHAARRRRGRDASRRDRADRRGSSRPRRPHQVVAHPHGRDPNARSGRGACEARADPGRASPLAAARDASLVPRDRGAARRLPQHREDAGDLDLQEARRHGAQRRDRGGRASRPVRGGCVVVTVVRRHLAEAAPQAPAVRRRVRRAALLPFEVAESKLRVPVLRSGTVSRTGLVNRLRARRDFSVATIVAPAGYGKTTLLAQWAARDPRPFAWISIDERDDDPIVLLRQLAAALHAIRPLHGSVIDALSSSDRSIWEAAVPRLGAALSTFKERVVIVVDDAHLLRSRESSEALAAVADHLAAGSVLVLAGRSSPALPIAALRATGRLFEIGITQLALTPREGHLVLRSTGADLSLAESTELVKHCEGWPAGLSLAALALRED